ncbi:unnamed protein product [Blepharisma stoltei]|uniref:Uncharacterized protein n=1 Tax=Blepharisma stoltei TaxID=1481888 RepID=A0AAU9J9T3_9CILI|nr:unnamed protein product [Blepharisma stoltei]
MNSSSITGNAILAFSTALNISQCKFLNTESSSSGGVISVFGSRTFIQKSLFENFKYSAIEGSEMEFLKIVETSFKNSQGKIGGAISCTNTDYVYINSCVFDNGTSIYGGALYFAFTDNTINSKNYEIMSTEFVNNTSSAGGAIYLDNINADIKYCRFYDNKAQAMNQSSEATHDSGIGGAMKLGCSYSGECNFNVFSNDFVGNIADYEGGAIVYMKRSHAKFPKQFFWKQ